jgi:hypothetical protein
VVKILKGGSKSDRVQLSELSTLKALVVLYSFANASAPSSQSSEMAKQDEILYWPLKSLVETYALQLSLHQAVYGLQSEIISKKGVSLVESASYQKYVFWLQLFTLSRL